MNYIAVLDYKHLDNSLFLKAFAGALARQKPGSGLIIHGQSAHTERLIQTGMMRDDAARRAIKELNQRLIGLLADEGVAAIGLNGYQKSFISQKDNEYHVDKNQLNRLPSNTFVVLSNLIETHSDGTTALIDLDQYAILLKTSLDIDEVLVFSLDDSDEFISKPRPAEIQISKGEEEFSNKYIPDEFRTAPLEFRLTTARIFGNYPDNKGTTFVRRGD